MKNKKYVAPESVVLAEAFDDIMFINSGDTNVDKGMLSLEDYSKRIDEIDFHW